MDSAVPPDASAYQSMVSPAPTLADMEVFAEPKQVALETPDVGTPITGQLQTGAVTANSVVQPFKVAVIVTVVPALIPEMVLAELFTVPSVEVTVPLLANTIVYEIKSAEHLALVNVNVGFAFI